MEKNIDVNKDKPILKTSIITEDAPYEMVYDRITNKSSYFKKIFPRQIYRTLYEKGGNKNAKTFTEFSELTFCKLNDENNGVYFSPQSYSGNSNKKQYLAKINTLFADLDVAKSDDGQMQDVIEEKKNILLSALQSLSLPPSAVVNTRNGLQPYWYINVNDVEESTVARCENVIRGIAEWAKKYGSLGDNVHDIVHLLRVPGFNHCKKEPYPITVIDGNDNTYDLTEMEAAFPHATSTRTAAPTSPPSVGTQENRQGSLIDQVNQLDIREVVVRVWESMGHTASFDNDNHLIVDNVATATFANRDGKNFIATTSGEFPADGNAVTYVADTLKIGTKDAFWWIVKECDLQGQNTMIKVFQPLTEVMASLKEVLASISEDTARGDLSVALTPLLEKVAKEMGPADAESFVRLNIKKHFDLTGAEIGGFVKKLRELNPSATTHSGDVSQADRLVEMILKEGSEFFKNEVGDAFARIKAGDHFEVLPVKSKNFRLWAVGLFYKNTKGKAMNSDAYQTARTVIENKCIFEGKEYNIHPRVAYEEGVVWYDLADPQWRAVRVDKDGWHIEKNPPILFRRYQHMRAQAAPCGSLDPREIFEFINIEDEEMKLLLLVWIISCFVKGFPHPAPMLYGPQGSAKTTASEILKAIPDPSTMKTTRLSHDLKEVTQILAHSWLTIFDNVSHDKFFDSTSDLLCTVITGGGVSKRELYSDDDDIIYDLQRVVGLNGINLVASRPDLLDRSILIELARIPEEKRKSADDVSTTFREKLPGILGGIFDTLVKVINIKPTLTFPKGLLRMADFTVWGSAIAIALGYTREQFFSAYTNNIKRQNEGVINDSLVASLISSLLERSDGWEGTSTQLLQKLGENENSEQDETLKRDTSFPKAANALSRALNELKTSLAETGCFVWQTGSSRKQWHISKTPEPPIPMQRSLLPSSEREEEHPINPTITQTLIPQDESVSDMGDVCDVPRTVTDEGENSTTHQS